MDTAQKLIDPKNTAALIREHEFRIKKRLGQNFLIDSHVLDKIISGAQIGREDTVLEIGPGIGTLTQALCEKAGEVIAVEIDSELIPILEQSLSAYPNKRIINGDILKLDLAGLSDRPLKVAANLPYYITTPIVMRLLETDAPVQSITVMVQKEVADRMQAFPGGKDYGVLSLSVQYYAEAEIIANVPPNCFVPRPSVGSAVIRLTIREHPPVHPKSPERMFRLIRTAFSKRRKTLVNTLRNEASVGYTREEIETALAALALPADIRGERLTLAQFADLSDLLPDKSVSNGKDLPVY